jgi:RNA polymerase sigma factor (sigma-70 family)
MARGKLGGAANDLRKLWDAGTMSGLSDARLLERVTAEQDKQAFDALIERHAPLVWSVCRSILSDGHDVEDAFQASFLILVRKARSLRVGDSLCGWLYRVSYRVAQEARARRARLQARERSAVDEAMVAANVERTDHELLAILSRELDRLQEKYRLPIVLCRLEGMTHQEAALQLGWPPGTVGTRLARGLSLLSARMRRRIGGKAGDQHGWLGALDASSVPRSCQEATARAALSMLTSGVEPAAWSRNALSLAQAVQTAAFRTSLLSFTLIAGGTCIAVAGLLAAIVASKEPDRGPVRAAVDLKGRILIRGRVIDSRTRQPVAGTVLYAPLKGNPNLARFPGDAQKRQDLDDHGEFSVVGLPGPGAVIVTAGKGETLFFPRTPGVSAYDMMRGAALADDELMLDTVPRPVSLVGSHAFKRIDAPNGDPDIEVNFALALHPGKTVVVRAVEPSGRGLSGVIAFGLEDPISAKAESVRGDGPFPVRNLDPGWPRRVMFLAPGRSLAGFRDLTGDEGGEVTVRLDRCASITGRVVDRAGTPIGEVGISLVYDDPKNKPHIGFPNGKWVPTFEEITRDGRLHPDAVTVRPLNLVSSSSNDGRFQIPGVVPGVKCHLQVVVTNARRLGMRAPRGEGKKPVFDRALSVGENLDLGDVRVVPEELRGKR